MSRRHAAALYRLSFAIIVATLVPGAFGVAHACGGDGEAPCTTSAASLSSSKPFCASGSFFDPRNGGECWSCPGGYTRSAAAVTAGNACYIPAGERLSSATRHNKTAFAWDCKGGTFWDGYQGGYCWSCPGGYNRTANHINRGDACSASVPEKQATATLQGKPGCSSGTFFDPRNGGECWSCPGGYNRNLNPVANSDACTAQAPCRAGLKLASEICVSTDAAGRPRTCGRLNQRPCTVAEFIPSCERGLTELGGNGRCITDNIAARTIGVLNAALDPAKNAKIAGDAANAVAKYSAFLSKLRSAMTALGSDPAGAAALKRIEAAIRTRQPDAQSRMDLQNLGRSLGLLAGDAKSVLPPNVQKSSFGVFLQVSGGAIVGVSESYAMIMNAAPDAGTFQIGLIQALGGSLGPQVGASGQLGIFWQPGTIDDAPGGQVGLGVEATAGIGGAVGVSWNVSEGMEKKPEAWTQAIPGFQLAFSPGAKLSAAAVGGWTTLLGKWEVAAASAPTPTLASTSWSLMPGAATDIGVGANGAVWVIGTNAVGGGGGIHRWGGNGWVNMNGGGVRIDVDPQGYAWVANNSGDVYRYTGSTWVAVPGIKARDIGVGANGSVWVIGTNAVGGGGGIWRWDGKAWVTMSGGGVRIDVDPQGNAWVANNSGDVYRYTGSTWVAVPGIKARDIGIGGDGSVFAAAQDGGVYKWENNAWVRREGGLVEISVDGRGVPYGANAGKQIYMGSK